MKEMMNIKGKKKDGGLNMINVKKFGTITITADGGYKLTPYNLAA